MMKTRTPPIPAGPVLGAAAMLALSGCVSFGAKVPPQLLRLTPAAMAPAGPGQVLAHGVAVTVNFPSAPVELTNNRVPVRTGPTEIAYVKNAQWIDVPTHLFRDLLAETITTRTGRPTLTPRDSSLAPGPKLGGRLLWFGIESGSNQASVVYDATLVRSADQVETRRFEAHAAVSGAITESSSGTAINAAANDVATQVADWVGR